jgi:uncharacterized membrane protein
MDRRPAVLLGVLLLATLSVGIAAVTADDPGDSDAPVSPVTTPEGFDSTAFEIRVYENGSARWTIKHVRPLENETQIRNYREYASRFNTQETRLVRRFRNNTRLVVGNVSDALGRQMTADNFHHRASIEELGATRGVIELSYTWTGFARVGEETVVVGDVFAGGLYIFENQRVVFEHGPTLRFVQALPEPDSMSAQGNLTASDTITWQGDRQFNDDRPLVRYAEPAVAQSMTDGGTTVEGIDGEAGGDGGANEAGDGSDGGPQGGDSVTGGGLGTEVVGLLIVLIVGIGLGVAWYADAIPPGTGPAEAETAASPADGSTEDAATGATAGAAGAAVEPAVSDEELLSDEDRVLSLLEEHGGRMKQVNIVDETEWSKSKVSMLLSDMEDDGDISKLRVGRENIVSLAGQEPEAAGSPFEED